jgi:hypothetical protein
MGQTLLKIVQDILSAMNGDEVNSIQDTEEAVQVARIVEGTYLAMMSNTTWPHTRRALTVSARSSSDFPTYIKVVDNLKELISIYYNTKKITSDRDNYTKLTWLEPDNFLYKTNLRDSSQDNVETIIDDSGIKIFILSDKAPEYYTSFNDVDIILDSYDKNIDNTIQVSKIQALGYIVPVFKVEDTFIPDLPVDAFSMLIERSKSTAQFNIRQVQDIKAEQESTRQSRWMSRKAWTVSGGIKYPDYGRKGSVRPLEIEKKWPVQ